MIGIWLLMKWLIICTLFMILLMELSRADLGFIKSVQDAFQNNSQKSMSATVWQPAKVCHTAVETKVTIIQMHCFWGTRCWIFHNVWEGELLSVEWKHPRSLVKRKFKFSLAWKVMLTHFWDAEWPVLEHCEDGCATLISIHYSKMLWERM
jgi:hypothetical protein